MSNLHSILDDSQLHVAKGHSTATNGSSIWKNEQGLQEWNNINTFPPCLALAVSSSAPPTETNGAIYLLDNSRGVLNVDTIAWQSGSIIRYGFASTPDLSTYIVGDYLTVKTATNSINNGTFIITTINDGADWIEVTNILRTDATDDEAAGSPATATSTLSNWDGCPQNSWAKYDLATDTWHSIAPYTGVICFNLALGVHLYFNGTSWLGIGESVYNSVVVRSRGTDEHKWRMTVDDTGAWSSEDLGV